MPLKHLAMVIHSDAPRDDCIGAVVDTARRSPEHGASAGAEALARTCQRGREVQATEDVTMRQRLLVPRGRTWHGIPQVLSSCLRVVCLALVIVGCASHSLMPRAQSAAIRDRERALASPADAIQTAIRTSGSMGALAFLDANDGRLVVLPGDSPADAWGRYVSSRESGTGRVSVPAVVTFVHRADVPMAPETVTRSVLEQQQAVRAFLATLTTDLSDVHRGIEERLGSVQRELAESI